MRYKTRDGLPLTLQVALGIFIAPLLTSFLIIAMIAYLHDEWWHVIPVMNYSTAYWGQVLMGALAYPIVYLLAKIRKVIS